MAKPAIIVTGKNGQLGYELQQLTSSFSEYDFHFFEHQQLDITDEVMLEQVFESLKPVAFINCAAYTAVDKAETDQVNAYRINAEAPGNIANFCRRYRTIFFHFSTDYVFDGTSSTPYKVDDVTAPINYYGYTKWMGEELARKNHDSCIIIRTSWVYSTHGNNFVKTMLRLMNEREELKIVNDQQGCPTYAADLAATVLTILPVTLNKSFKEFGIYHYSNKGQITWFQFAEYIKEVAGLKTKLLPISFEQFPTPAKRPAYSVFDLTKISGVFGLQLIPWQESVKTCVTKLQNQH